MTKYILKRVGYSIVTLFLLVAITFFMMQLLPGDPFTGEKQLPAAQMEALYAKYGLDKPVWQQFFIYIGNVVQGDLGVSLTYNRAVTLMITEAFAVSFDVGIRSICFAFIGGVLLGTLAAIKRGKAADTVAMIIALLGVSVPSFVVASILQYFLGLKMYQATGMRIFAITGWEGFNSHILPVIALGFGSLATISRLMRTSMLDVLGQDYIKTAKAKGLSQSGIIFKHAMRNAIMPVVTVLGPITAGILTGGFVVESVFGIPGLGKYFVQSIQGLDYTMICGGVFNDALATYVLEHKDKILERNRKIVFGNRDIAQAWIDTQHRVSWTAPQGVSTSFIQLDIPEDDEEFCRRLLSERGVLLVPGSRFELPCGARLGYCASEDVLREGLRLLGEALAEFDR